MDSLGGDSLSTMDELKDKTKTVLAKLQRLTLSEEPEDRSSSGKSNRTRRSRRGKQQQPSDAPSTSTSDACWAPGPSHPSLTVDPIDHCKQFVLELLRLPEDKWLEHIASVACHKGVLVQKKGREGRRYTWNVEHEANDHTKGVVEKLNLPTKRDRDRGKKRRFLNLDETINEMISDSKFHVTLSPHKIRSEQELDKQLQRFAEMLKVAGLGYITEGELFVTMQGNTAFVRTDPEVVIRKQKLRRCALNGDIVRVFVFKNSNAAAIIDAADSGQDEEEEEEEPIKDLEAIEELAKCSATGFIIRVVKKFGQRTCTGQFGGTPTAKTANLTFFPHDRRIPPINVPSKHLDSFIPRGTDPEDFFRNLPQRLYEVEITGVNSFYYICNGIALGDLGTKGNIMDENACILLRHGFKKNRIDRLERLGQVYADKAKAMADDPTRRDLTEMCIFTIDPATARDLDDAVSCQLLENGHYLIGIHISDVTHYVVENSDLDTLVQEAKTTSVYMVDQVYHMLPSSLCQTCSLLPGERKQAVSVFVEMSPDAKVISTEFTRSAIISCCQLSYEQAQKIIDDEDPLDVAPVTIYNEFKGSDLRSTIKSLDTLAKQMRDRRMKSGALKFDKPKYYFKLDADNNPIEFLSEMSRPAHHLIEEFMILANQLVGEHIYKAYPTCAILRQHSPPKLDQMAKVRTFYRELGFPELNYRTAKEINASMDAILEECDRRQLSRQGFELVLNGMLARPMNRAQYFCTGDDRYTDRFDHFALSIPFYTHFTSPIRRYPDILVHRLLIRAIKKYPAPKNWKLDEINHLMVNCNREKTNSRYASEDSARLFLMHYLAKNFPEGKVMRATVCSLNQNSLEVKLWDTGDELVLHHADLEVECGQVTKLVDGIMVTVEDETNSLMTSYLRMFTTCQVKVTVHKEKLRATLIV